MTEKQNKSNQLAELLLLPVIRFCVRHSIKFQEFSEVARHLYLRVAEDALVHDGFEPNVSRLAITSGLQRRDVTRLWKEGRSYTKQPGILHKVVGHWMNDSRFSRKSGSPKKLHYKGADSEFAELVRTISQDLNVYTVLFELERLNLVEKQGETLTLLSDTVDSRKDTGRSIELLSDDMNDLICAVDENVFANNENPNHHVKTQYDNVVVEALPKIRKWLLNHGAAFHKEARAYISRFDKDIQPNLSSKKGEGRVAIGSFSLTTAPRIKEKD